MQTLNRLPPRTRTHTHTHTSGISDSPLCVAITQHVITYFPRLCAHEPHYSRRQYFRSRRVYPPSKAKDNGIAVSPSKHLSAGVSFGLLVIFWATQCPWLGFEGVRRLSLLSFWARWGVVWFRFEILHVIRLLLIRQYVRRMLADAEWKVTFIDHGMRISVIICFINVRLWK